MAMTRREMRMLRAEAGSLPGGAEIDDEFSAPNVRVLVVCTGNVVRSPFLAHLFSTLTLPGLTFDSAGIRAVEGASASGRVQEIAAQYGIDLSEHRARRLDEMSLASASVVVCAAREHKKDVLRLNPGGLNRVFTLRELSRASTVLPLGDLVGAPVARWDALVEYAATHRQTSDDDDIPDPYRLGDKHWWDFEQAALDAALPVMRYLVGATP